MVIKIYNYVWDNQVNIIWIGGCGGVEILNMSILFFDQIKMLINVEI